MPTTDRLQIEIIVSTLNLKYKTTKTIANILHEMRQKPSKHNKTPAEKQKRKSYFTKKQRFPLKQKHHERHQTNRS